MTAEFRPGERIEKISIPDSDMPGWIEAIHNSGLSQEELDAFFSRLNFTYAKEKGIIDIDAEVKQVAEYILKEYGRQLSDEQLEYIRTGIRQKYGLDKE